MDISVGSIGLLLAGALCFIPVPSAPKAVKIIVFLAGYIIWDAFYTVANVPYGSLLSLISNDPGDRASLSAFRLREVVFHRWEFQELAMNEYDY